MIELTLSFSLRISIFVSVSALAMTGTMFTLWFSFFMNWMSIGRRLHKKNHLSIMYLMCEMVSRAMYVNQTQL